jgi:hypothetical protein
LKLEIELKYRRYAISNLMTYIIALNAVVFVIDLFIPQSNLFAKLALNPAMILRGEVWRLITFLFLPPSTSPIWISICPILLLSGGQQPGESMGELPL